ncbi:hypothetical protein BCR39DRAFT_535890 [Naematelia encephala]|uniref:Uncharacterized protein n=1 Tax=Naematelia encephala TaxID=71784 RepID=A0A1Y2B0C3_9TREE|nr:hypothetical protein BCR39DRAFT_535890 [Naematelia encephala]
MDSINPLPIHPLVWKATVRESLIRVGLSLWLREVDGVARRGVEPPRSDAAWNQWYLDYETARAAICGPDVLKGSFAAVVESNEFFALPDLEPIPSVYQVVEKLVQDVYESFERQQASSQTIFVPKRPLEAPPSSSPHRHNTVSISAFVNDRHPPSLDLPATLGPSSSAVDVTDLTLGFAGVRLSDYTRH